MWAAILTVLTYPVYERLATKLGPNRASLVTTAGVTLIIIVPMMFVLSAFVRQAVDAVRTIQLGVELGQYTWVNRLWGDLQRRFPRLIPSDLGDAVHNYAEQAASYAAGRVGGILRNTATFLMDTTFTILSMFYFYRDGAAIVNRIRDGLPFEEAQRVRVVNETHSLIFATVLSTLTAACGSWGRWDARLRADGNQVADFLGRSDGIFFFYSLDRHRADLGAAVAQLGAGGPPGAGIILAVICSVVLGNDR